VNLSIGIVHVWFIVFVGFTNSDIKIKNRVKTLIRWVEEFNDEFYSVKLGNWRKTDSIFYIVWLFANMNCNAIAYWSQNVKKNYKRQPAFWRQTSYQQAMPPDMETIDL